MFSLLLEKSPLHPYITCHSHGITAIATHSDPINSRLNEYLLTPVPHPFTFSLFGKAVSLGYMDMYWEEKTIVSELLFHVDFSQIVF